MFRREAAQVRAMTSVAPQGRSLHEVAGGGVPACMACLVSRQIPHHSGMALLAAFPQVKALALQRQRIQRCHFSPCLLKPQRQQLGQRADTCRHHAERGHQARMPFEQYVSHAGVLPRACECPMW